MAWTGLTAHNGEVGRVWSTREANLVDWFRVTFIARALLGDGGSDGLSDTEIGSAFMHNESFFPSVLSHRIQICYE